MNENMLGCLSATLSVLRSKFSESIAVGKLWALRKRLHSMSNIQVFFHTKWGLSHLLSFKYFLQYAQFSKFGKYHSAVFPPFIWCHGAYSVMKFTETNRVQAKIFEYNSKCNNRFLVTDYLRTIYKVHLSLARVVLMPSVSLQLGGEDLCKHAIVLWTVLHSV